jgi:hypothetical protein
VHVVLGVETEFAVCNGDAWAVAYEARVDGGFGEVGLFAAEGALRV